MPEYTERHHLTRPDTSGWKSRQAKFDDVLLGHNFDYYFPVRSFKKVVTREENGQRFNALLLGEDDVPQGPARRFLFHPEARVTVWFL